MNFDELGWDDARREEFAPWAGKGFAPARVLIRHKGMYTVALEREEAYARIKGVLRYEALSWAEMPVVGDWVAVHHKPHESLWRIGGILKRRTALCRKVKGTQTSAQVLAANITHVVIVMALAEDFNLRRLERYLVLTRESGARPFIVLNKADLLDDATRAESLELAREVAHDAPIALVSAVESEGIDALAPILQHGNTLVFVGSSGAGKSTLINALLGEERLRTGDVRESDGRGRHTTTTREMLLLPGGAVLIDSPGIREIQLWDAEEGLAESFADVAALAAQCRFRDCSHEAEPGCAIRAALESGALDPARLASYRQLAGELGLLKERERDLASIKNRRPFRPWKRSRTLRKDE